MLQRLNVYRITAEIDVDIYIYVIRTWIAFIHDDILLFGGQQR